MSVNTYAQDFSEDDKKILMLQDTRSLGENRELLNYLQSQDDKIVQRVLIALSNIQDSTTVDEIGNVLLNSDANQKKFFACFALGQIPCGKSNEYLINSFLADLDTQVTASAIYALGKTGDARTLEFLLNNVPDNYFVKNGLSFAIAKFAIRKITSAKAVDFLCRLAEENSPPVDRGIIAYAFARTRNKDLLLPSHNTILALSKSDDWKTRMWAFSALGYISDINDMDYLIASLNKEENWQTKVNILNSLLLYKKTSESILDEKLVNAITYRYDDANPNVVHTALRVTALLFSELSQPNQNLKTIKERLEWFFPHDKAVEWQDKCEAILAYGTIFKDEVKKELLLKMSETENESLVPYIIKSFQFFKDGSVCRELTDSVRAVVQRHNKANNQESGEMIQDEVLANIYRAYVEALSALKSKVDAENRKYIMLIMTEFTGSKDPSILDICFTALNDKIYEGDRKEIQFVLMMDYKELSYPKDKDAMISFINEFGELQMKEAESILKENLNSPNYDICKASANALKKITGKEYTFKTKPKTDFDWDFIKTLSLKRFATINTNRGAIKIELLPEFFPFTVQNFVKLSEKKFYDGTIFHRIVPNFVIQGGDPMNNGYGGPEFSIRSEFSGFFYKEGAVGMASDGKDTEGSQFFIMHSPHHHLNGNYTLFGYVKEGQDVVDHIVPFDKIINITFSEN
jgi:cyclophilin family peptidyl-prolyl cis-trans isomerase